MIPIPDSLQQVLKDCTITDSAVLLPAHPIPSDTYESFDHLMIDNGGKWKKGKGYLFSVDPRQLFCPPSLVALLVGMLDVQAGDYVLCPEATQEVALELAQTKAAWVTLTSEVLFMHCQGPFLAQKLRAGDFDRALLTQPSDVHAEHALSLLRPGGTLVAVLAPGERRTAVRRLLAAGQGSLTDLPDGNMVLKLVKS